MSESRWTGARAAELPSDWQQRRRACRDAAGGRCEYRFPRGGRCPEQGTDADHALSRDDHDHLQWLCRRHHQMKTQQESAAARRVIAAKGRHPVERHPGML